MNEKIKELYDDASYSSYVRTDGNGNDHYRRNTDYELFAKLIIEECAKLIPNTDLEDVEGGDSEVLLAAKRQLLQHFGIS